MPVVLCRIKPWRSVPAYAEGHRHVCVHASVHMSVNLFGTRTRQSQARVQDNKPANLIHTHTHTHKNEAQKRALTRSLCFPPSSVSHVQMCTQHPSTRAFHPTSCKDECVHAQLHIPRTCRHAWHARSMARTARSHKATQRHKLRLSLGSARSLTSLAHPAVLKPGNSKPLKSQKKLNRRSPCARSHSATSGKTKKGHL